jgi:hypothetical protein
MALRKANLPNLKTEIFNMMTASPNLTATEKTRLRDRFITDPAYVSKWSRFLAQNGGTDTPALRGQFVVEMTLEMWKKVYEDGFARETAAANAASTQTFG